MSMGLCPTRASRAGAPLIILRSTWFRHSQNMTMLFGKQLPATTPSRRSLHRTHFCFFGLNRLSQTVFNPAPADASCIYFLVQASKSCHCLIATIFGMKGRPWFGESCYFTVLTYKLYPLLFLLS